MGSHWYDSEGRLVVDAGVRDARRHNLYASVTSVYKIINNFGLTLWMQRQAALAGYTMPKSELSDKEVVNKIIEDGKEEAAGKAEWGTVIHNIIASYVSSNVSIDCFIENEEMRKPVLAVIEWINTNVKHPIYVEKGFVNKEHGFAGTPDLLAVMTDDKTAVIDWKSQTTKDGKFTKYPEWGWQLAACQILTGRVADRWTNVAISSNEPGLIKVYEWKPEKIAESEIIFLSILDTFKKINKL